MPYESPNIVIIPTTGFQKGKAETSNGSDLTEAGAMLSDREKDFNTPQVLEKPQSEVATAIPKDCVKMPSCQNVQGIVQSASNLKSDCVVANSTSLEDYSNMPCTSWAHSNFQSIGQRGTTITTKPNILCTSNDNREHNVSSTSKRQKFASRNEYKNVACMNEKKNVASTDGSKDVDSTKHNKASIVDKKNPPIKINLLSRSKVANTADTAAVPAMVRTTESLITGSRPYNDITWTFPLMPRTVNEPWIHPIPYQPTYPTLNTGYGVPMDGMLSQQYPTNIYTQNTNTNIMNTNYVRQTENFSYTHYYTPSYKSPMDSAWLNEQYYAQLVNDQSYKYFNQINRYESSFTKLPVTTSDTQITDKKFYLEKKSSVNDEIVKPNKSEISSKINKEKDELKTFRKIEPKKSINPDSFNLGNDFVEKSSHSKSESKKKTRETSDTKSKKSNFKEISIIDKAGSCKSKISTKSEASEKVKEMLKQIQILENLIAKKRKRSPEKTSDLRARDDEDSLAKKKKLSSNKSERDTHRKRDQDSTSKSKHLREIIEARPKPNRKRMRRSSNSEYQPKKRSRRNSENDGKRSNHANSIMSIVKTSQIKHPRIKAPESEDVDSDNDSKFDFDLRSILSRANYNHYIRNKAYYDSQTFDKTKTERENLLITINQNEDNNNDIQSKAVPSKHNDGIQSKADPSKPKQKPKKYKTIQFVINVICDKQDSSENSSSDETDLKDAEGVKVIETGSVFKSDLSFLDDINVDEIVNSLKHQQQTVANAMKVNAPNNVKESVENNKHSEKTSTNFVEPIVIKAEVRTENEDPDENINCSHEDVPESTLSDDPINLGPVNRSVSASNLESVENETEKANCSDVLQHIKQEKSFEMDDKAESEKDSGRLEGRQSPTIQELVSALSEKYKPANQDFKAIALENTGRHDKSTPEVMQSIKCELRENDEDIVNEENESQVLNTSNNHNNIEPISADLMDEDTQELHTYSACEPMDVDKTCTFCIPDMQISIKENNNDLNMSCKTQNTANIDGRSLTVIDKQNPATEDHRVRTMEHDLVANVVVTNSVITIENTITQLSQNDKSEAREIHLIRTNSSPDLGQIETRKDKEKPEDNTTTEPVVKIEESEVENNENVKIYTITDLKIETEISQPINIERNTQNFVPVATGTKTKQDQPKELACATTNAHILISKPVIVSSNTQNSVPVTTATYTKQDQPKELVCATTNAHILISKPVNDSTPRITPKMPVTDMSVKSKDDINDKVKKVPQTSKLSNKTNTIKKNLSPTPPNKGKVVKQESKDKNVKPTTIAKPGAPTSQKVDVTKNDSNEQKCPKTTDKPRTVQIKPSLKSNKILCLKIEERILEIVKLKISVTSMIHFGRYSKMFKCESASGKQYAVKFIKDEANRTTLGINKENMLLALQLDIPRQNLNTVFMISSFGVDRNWCFLTEYYPKNLKGTLRTTVFDMDTVQELSRQLVSAVMVMRNNNIVHSDIKPHHLLLDAANKRLKVCGFDEAYYMEELQKVIPNIGSSSYRAPEVIVGYSADFAIDVWTTALVIFEMISGSQLFSPRSYNNNTLFCQMSLLGYLPMDIIQMSPFARNHFVGTVFKRIMGGGKGQYILYNSHNFNMKKRIYPIVKGTAVQRWAQGLRKKNIKPDMKKLSQLCYILDNMLAIDPRQRTPIEHVYADPFFMYNNAQINDSTEFANNNEAH